MELTLQLDEGLEVCSFDVGQVHHMLHEVVDADIVVELVVNPEE